MFVPSLPTPGAASVHNQAGRKKVECVANRRQVSGRRMERVLFVALAITPVSRWTLKAIRRSSGMRPPPMGAGSRTFHGGILALSIC